MGTTAEPGDVGAVARPRRFTLPPFITELGDEPGAVRALVAATVAVAAAGLDPKVLSSGMPDSQAALHQRPELESVFLLAVLITATFTILGGLLGDVLRRRPVLTVALTLLVVAELGTAIFASGPLFLGSRLLASAATGTILPVALAVVAVAYRGAVRATALGIAYAALGAASATAPALLLATSHSLGRWPAFVLAAVVALIAIPLVRRHVPSTAHPGLSVKDVVGHGMWALGLLTITGGIVGARSDRDSPIRIALVLVGLCLVITFLLWQRRREALKDDAAIDVRPVTVALIAGVVIAVAQTAPAMQAPLFFQIVDGSSSLMATIAIAPFVLALLVTGPVAGLLLSRVSPRNLIVGGLVVVGIGDLLFAAAGPGTFYPYFIIPLAAIGAGFVVGTCVRTAVIFASVPRRLPATAAALNQSSLLIGGQIGIAAVTAIVSTTAIASYTATSTAAGADSSAADGFRSFIDAVGTSQFGETIASLSDSVRAGYGAAYAAGVSQALFTVGTLALGAALICWLAMGTQVPLTSVWEHRDERKTPTAGAGARPEPDPAV